MEEITFKKEKETVRVAKIPLLILCFAVYASNVLADQKGSDTLVSIEPFFDFPAGLTDNEMLTFGYFKDGFGLADFTTSCTFKSIFPVSGNINLRGGQLCLQSDLNSENVTNLLSSGTIIGNSHAFDFAQSITGIPASYNSIFQDTKVFLNSDLLISGKVRFRGNCLLDGAWNRVTLAEGAQILVDRNASLYLRNIEIDGIKNNIHCLDDSSSLILDNMLWAQDADTTFTTGSMKFVNNVNFVGPWTFEYASKMTSTIDQDSTWFISDLTKLTIGRQGSIFAREPLYFFDVTSVLKMNNSILNVSQYGMRLTRGTFLVDGEVKFDINSTNSSNGLAFGNGLVSGDMAVKYSPAAIINFEYGDLVHDTVAANNFVSGSLQKIFLRRGAGTNYWSNFDSNFINVSLIFGIGGISYLAPGKRSYFTNSTAKIGALEFSLTATRVSDFIFGLYGGGSIRVTAGAFMFPLGIAARGVGNVFTSINDVSASITLNDAMTQLNLGINGNLIRSPLLNGGTIILTSDLSLDQGAVLTGTGSLVMSNFSLNTPLSDTVWTSSDAISSTNGSINLRSRLSLTSTITISGTCTINGNDNELHIRSTGKIVIAPNASLRFKNVLLSGISGSRIRCVDNTGVMTLEEMVWAQDGGYSFGLGSMRVKGNCKFMGDGQVFGYASSMTSTILQLSNLILDKAFTFSYDPIDKQSNNIEFIDDSSVFIFSSANLYVANGGLQFKKGQIDIRGNTNFFAEYNVIPDSPYSSTTGIILGDNDGIHDAKLLVRQGAKLSQNNGYLIYRNTNRLSLEMQNVWSRIRINPDAILFLEQSLPIDPGVLELSSYSVLLRAEGATIDGSVNFG